jgi:maltooligosyltrehalose trehalohydrolase
VARGRRAEFARFAGFASDADLQRIPDPNDEATFRRSQLDWSELDQAGHAVWLEDHRQLLALRQEHIAPLLPRFQGGCGKARVIGDAAVEAAWTTDRGERLTLLANLSDKGVAAPTQPAGERIHATPAGAAAKGTLGPWSAHWYLQRP